MNQKMVGDRLHGLDALRAIAMFLGVVLHASIAYKVMPLPAWPSDPNNNSLFWDYLYSFIHSFRMPLFYLIAGFFCSMLFYKIGLKAFVKHRINRIVIPFICSVVLLLPFTTFPFLLYKNLIISSWDWSQSLTNAARQLLKWNGMAHFWFLYYLIFYYIIYIAIEKIFKFSFLLPVTRGIKKSFTTNDNVNIYLVIVSIIVVFILLLMNKDVLIGVDTGIIPNPVYLIYYGFFFFVGCVINFHKKYFEFTKTRSAVFLIAGLIISGIVFYLEVNFKESKHTIEKLVLIKVFFSIQSILLVNAFLGLFLKYFTKDNAMWRYFSDASYWVYLLHLGLIAFFQTVLINEVVFSPIKFCIVLLATTIISLLSYHFFVRYSILGHYLHGSRKK